VLNFKLHTLHVKSHIWFLTFPIHYLLVNSPSSSAEVKNTWNCTSTPPYVLRVWYLVKCRRRRHGAVLS